MKCESCLTGAMKIANTELEKLVLLMSDIWKVSDYTLLPPSGLPCTLPRLAPRHTQSLTAPSNPVLFLFWKKLWELVFYPDSDEKMDNRIPVYPITRLYCAEQVSKNKDSNRSRKPPCKVREVHFPACPHPYISEFDNIQCEWIHCLVDAGRRILVILTVCLKCSISIMSIIVDNVYFYFCIYISTNTTQCVIE